MINLTLDITMQKNWEIWKWKNQFHLVHKGDKGGNGQTFL